MYCPFECCALVYFYELVKCKVIIGHVYSDKSVIWIILFILRSMNALLIAFRQLGSLLERRYRIYSLFFEEIQMLFEVITRNAIHFLVLKPFLETGSSLGKY